MLRSKKIYIPPSMTLYAAASGLMAISHKTPDDTPPLIEEGEGGDPAGGLAKEFTFDYSWWFEENDETENDITNMY